MRIFQMFISCLALPFFIKKVPNVILLALALAFVYILLFRFEAITRIMNYCLGLLLLMIGNRPLTNFTYVFLPACG